eukprot:6168835-Pyramimonas_sp.AAC.1
MASSTEKSQSISDESTPRLWSFLVSPWKWLWNSIKITGSSFSSTPSRLVPGVLMWFALSRSSR